jgi:hypothetical protein
MNFVSSRHVAVPCLAPATAAFLCGPLHTIPIRERRVRILNQTTTNCFSVEQSGAAINGESIYE